MSVYVYLFPLFLSIPFSILHFLALWVCLSDNEEMKLKNSGVINSSQVIYESLNIHLSEPYQLWGYIVDCGE